MRVLILSQHFSPEVTAARFRIEPFVVALVERGHDVEVICAVPNHPEGIVHSGYRGRAILREQIHGAQIKYVWVRAAPTKTLRTRLGVLWLLRRHGACRGRGHEATGCHPGQLTAALRRPRRRTSRRPSSCALGPRRPRSLAEGGGGSRRVDIATGDRGGRAARAVALSQGGHDDDRDRAVSPAHRRSVAARLADRGVAQRHDAGVAGTRGPRRRTGDRWECPRTGSSGPMPATSASTTGSTRRWTLRSCSATSFQLLLIGHGPLRDELERRAAALPAGRVRLEGLMSPDDAAARLLAADALLVALRASLTDVDLLEAVRLLRAGRPVIVAADGETRRLAEGAALIGAAGGPAGARRRRSDAQRRSGACREARRASPRPRPQAPA